MDKEWIRLSIALFSTIESSLFGSLGSMYIAGLAIMVFFIIAFVIAGMDFKYAIMFTSPLVLAFVEMGWFPVWISTVFWLLIAGLGIFLWVTYMSDR